MREGGRSARTGTAQLLALTPVPSCPPSMFRPLTAEDGRCCPTLPGNPVQVTRAMRCFCDISPFATSRWPGG
ncbi:hypothetical protein N658DRAFT_497291 [Parathielavia hyrcaniae]|uniref:Uncharacterized protein n=1 Tax=Parathielavia hyrcaniae TaxID=113614 RepID=A0AAN6Q2I9_9PEZI|nr:hypothetical protein N658DRAFT_497291 [Parathielavia hyrcaniae]